MDKSKQYKEWFDNNNKDWLLGAYGPTDYDYPVGQHRLRILMNAIAENELTGKSILDIGCGGGDISYALAGKGANVIGIDMSDNMLEVANHRKESEYADLTGSVCFRKENILDLSDDIAKRKFDYIVAFGLIGYLESDGQFFEIVKELSHEGTILFVSSRNELFNMTSISPNTVKEINDGNAIELINEIDQYYAAEIPEDKSRQFLNEMEKALSVIRDRKPSDETKEIHIDEKAMLSFARQSTPRKLADVAKNYQFKLCQYWGVHPHLLLPRINRKLPPQVFNILSDALCVFEAEDISLVWSSVFIGKFIL